MLREKPAARVRGYETHVLFCSGGDCKKRGARDVRGSLKDELRSEGMHQKVRVDSVDCLGLCKHGPNAIVYPSGTWYVGLTPEDISEIVERHFRDGDPVEHLTAERRPIKKKLKADG